MRSAPAGWAQPVSMSTRTNLTCRANCASCGARCFSLTLGRQRRRRETPWRACASRTWSPSSKGGSRRRRWFRGDRDVLRVVLGEQLLLPILLREEEEDQRGAEQDRDDPGDVGPLVPLEEGRLRGGHDLILVLRVPLG